MPIHHHIKHWLVPHRHNNHRPHLIRRHGLLALAVLIIGLQFAAYTVRPADVKVLAYASNITPGDLLTQTNQQRAANGVAPLHMDARLNSSAHAKADNMFAENYWAHVSPSGIQPWYWFTQAGYTYQYAGENLAKDFDTTSGVMDGWMNSPGHRANILNPNYTDVGFAVENGTLVGGQTTLVVAHYGQPAAPAVAAAPVAAAPAAPAPLAPKATATPHVVASPVATPLPTATPTPTPSPSPSPTNHPAAASIGQSAPPAQNTGSFRPVSILRSLNWGTLVTLGLLGVLLMVYGATHLAAWRLALPQWRRLHYRGLAFAQLGTVSIIMLVIATSGFGRVG